MKEKQFKKIASAGIISGIVMLGGAMASAASITTPIKGNHTFNTDTDIVISTNDHAVSVGSGETVTGPGGVKVTIDVTNNDMNQYGIFTQSGGRVDIDKIGLNSYSIGGYAIDGGKIIFGAGAEVTSDVGAALFVYGNDSKIEVGADANLTSSYYGSGGGTLSAGGGGLLVIGTDSNIINDFSSAPRNDDHYVIFADSDGRVEVGDGAAIKVTGSNGNNNHAVMAGNGIYKTAGTVIIGKNSAITTDGSSSYGVAATQAGSYAEVGQGTQIIMGGIDSVGFAAINQSAAHLEDGAEVVLEEDGSTAVYAYDGGQVTGGNGIQITAHGDNSSGLHAENGTIELGEGLSITMNGTGSNGINVYANGKVEVGAGSQINMTATGMHNGSDETMAHGVWVEGGRNGAQSDFADAVIGADSTITTNGVGSFGVVVENRSGSDYGKVTLNDGVSIQTAGLYSGGLYAEGPGAFIEGGDDISVSTEGFRAPAVWAREGGGIALGDNAAISAANDSALYSEGQGSAITIGKNSVINGGMYAYNESDPLKSQGYPSGTVWATQNGLITIDDGARLTANVVDDAMVGYNVVYADHGGAVEIGDNSIIAVASTGAGSHNYNVFAGSKVNNSTGHITIGQNAVITSDTRRGYGLLAIQNGSTIELGDGAAFTMLENGNVGAGAQAGGAIIIGNDVGMDLGPNAKGLEVMEASSLTAGNNLKITAGDSSYGIYVGDLTQNYGHNAVTLGDNTQIILKDFHNTGIAAVGNSSVSLGDNTKIEIVNGTLWTSNVGIRARATDFLADDETALVSLGDGAHIQVRGNGSYGITAEDNSQGQAAGAKVVLGSNASVTMEGDNAHGIAARGLNASVLTGDNTTISTDGARSHGVYATYGGTTELGSGAVITTTGHNAHGVLAENGGYVNLTNAAIETNGEWASGLFAYYTNEDGAPGSITMTGGSVITNGTNGYTVRADDGNSIYLTGVDVESRGYFGWAVQASGPGSTIDLKGGSSVTTLNEKSNGVFAATGGRVDLAETAVSTSGDESLGLYTYIDGTIVMSEGSSIITKGRESHAVFSMGEIFLTPGKEDRGAITIEAKGEEAYALFAGGGGIFSSLDGTLDSGGRFNITGDMVTEEDGAIALRMLKGSVFNGKTTQNDGYIDLTMVDSLWNISGSSTMRDLTLCGSTVDFREAALGTTLTVNDLRTIDNSATFFMKVDFANMINDKVYITGSQEGNAHFIAVRNDGSQTTNGSEILRLVYTTKNNDDKLSFSLGGDSLSSQVVEVGGFRYRLAKLEVDENDNVILPEGHGLAPMAGNAYDVNWVLMANGQAATAASASINTFAGSYLLGYAENQTLLQRLGALHANDASYGIWAKGYSGRFDSSGSDFLSGYGLKYSGLQTGLDYKLSLDGLYNSAYIGAMLGYVKGNINYDTGRGSVDMKTFGLYGTYTGDCGLYADLVLKYNWMKNDFKVIDSQNQYVTGQNMDTGGLGASLEVGRRFNFDDDQANGGVYLEPQAQLSYSHQNGGNFKASNGLNVEVASYNSLLGRLGLNAGYEIKNEESKVNIYLKGSFVNEFEGDVKARLNGAEIKESFGDRWFVYGAGANLQLADRHNIYVDVERAEGGQFRQPWAVNGGYRLTF